MYLSVPCSERIVLDVDGGSLVNIVLELYSTFPLLVCVPLGCPHAAHTLPTHLEQQSSEGCNVRADTAYG